MTNPVETIQVSGEAKLLERIARHDPSAVGELYDLQSSFLYTIILRIVNDESVAEEVLQEVFVHVWEKAGIYQPALSPPFVWLTRIARTLTIERSRSKISMPLAREEDIKTRTPIQDGGDDGGTDIAAVHSDQQREIAEALMQLPLEQRTLIEHAYFKGYTVSELAEYFKLPLGTVRARVCSGMSTLRIRLQHLIQ